MRVQSAGHEAEGLELLRHGRHVEDLRRRTVRLHPVVVDEHHEVVEPVVAGRHRRFPHLPFLQLAVGDEAVDAGVGATDALAERHPDRLREPLAERAAGDLEAGRPLERALLDPRAVHPVRAQLVELVDASLVEGGEDGDRAVPGREDEVIDALAQLVEVEARHQVGEREPLARVALASPAAHLEHRAADRRGPSGQLLRHAHEAAFAMPSASSPSCART